VNVAFNKTATSSSTYVTIYGWKGEACKAVNGRTDRQFSPNNCIHTADGDKNPSWSVDLGQPNMITGISIHRRDGDKTSGDLENSKHFDVKKKKDI
jgi:hypothetical protein